MIVQAGEYYSAGLVRHIDGRLDLSVFDDTGARIATETVSNVLVDTLASLEQVTTGARDGSVPISVDNQQFFDRALSLAELSGIAWETADPEDSDAAVIMTFEPTPTGPEVFVYDDETGTTTPTTGNVSPQGEYFHFYNKNLICTCKSIYIV